MNEYWDDWDIPITNGAIAVAQFPQEIVNWVWEFKREAFSIS